MAAQVNTHQSHYTPTDSFFNSTRIMATVKTKAQFVKPMLLLRTGRLPESQNLQYEVKLDGYSWMAQRCALIAGLDKRMRPGDVERLTGQHVDCLRIVRGDRIMRQVHVEVEGGFTLLAH